MTEASHHRFAEYATSGAFAVNLTRKQVSALAMLSIRGEHRMQFVGMDGLERKGLATILPPDSDLGYSENYITPAGLLVAKLCAMAGLTNSPVPTEAQEIEALHRDLAAARALIRELRQDCYSLAARLDEQTRDSAMLEDKLADRKPRIRVGHPLYPTDPQPGKQVDDMAFLRGWK